MKIRLTVPFAIVALCCAGPVFAAPANAPSSTAESEDSRSKVICQVQRELGSRLGSKRVCLTREQWRQQRLQQRQDLQRAQGSRTGPDISG
jgi:hypothetical protein